MNKKNSIWIALTVVLTVLSLLGGTRSVLAQESEGGTPPSFMAKNAAKSSSRQQAVTGKAFFKAPINFDKQQLLREDATNAQAGRPPRIATVVPVALSAESHGEWTTLPDGQQIWTLDIDAPGATAVMLYYDEFYIPQGGRLFIYNQAHTHVLGAYTSNTNLLGGRFATEFVAGESITLEYVTPLGENVSPPRIRIAGVGYGYNHLEIYQARAGLKSDMMNTSGACMVNINCMEGADWQDQKKGVVRTLTQLTINKDGVSATGVYLCSGSIVNNTSENGDGLYLTAAHCFMAAEPGTVLEKIDYETMTFYFHYEFPSCANDIREPVNSKTLVGAELLVNLGIQGKSDGTLLKLTSTIPDAYDVYWNGWDRTDKMPQSGVGIHHPNGDVKKISTYTKPGVIKQFSATQGTPAANAHININFAETANGYSVTEGGSSGSPLFNEEGLVVGTLSGGNSTCAAPAGDNLYGRLYFHWDKVETDPGNQMKTYLDPLGTGAEKLKGRYAAANQIAAAFTVSSTTPYATYSVQFVNQSHGADRFEWSFPGGSPSSSTERNPKVQYNVVGLHDVTLKATNTKTGESKTVAKPNYIDCRQYAKECPEYKEIGAGTDTSQFPLGLNQAHALSSAIYTKEEIGGGGLISELAWYANRSLTTVGRDMKIYLKEVDETTQTAATWEEEIAGATLVYATLRNRNYLNANNAEWYALKLTYPFQYSGAKNLKVMVQTSVRALDRYGSTACRYTNTPNAHMMWAGSSGTLPVAAGTVDGKRPNLRITWGITCPAVKPVAKFRSKIYEGFDEAAFPPIGWELQTKGESPNMWGRYSDIADYPFSLIDKKTVYSIIIIPDASKRVDSWLISNTLRINPESTLEFYLNANAKTYSKAQVNVYISTDNGATWGTPKWTTGNADDPNGKAGWRKQTIDLSAYGNSDIRIAWQYVGQDGSFTGLDGITIFSKDGKTTAYNGQTVWLEDLSDGPPMTWKWIFNESASTVQYYTQDQHFKIDFEPGDAGIYDFALTVGSNLGRDSASIKGLVTIIDHMPAAAVGGGVNAYPGYQKLVSKYHPNIQFKDISDYYPTKWSWVFANGSPGSSTVQNPAVTYPANIEREYGVKLTASNANGNSVYENDRFLRVGESGAIWNLNEGESGEYVHTSNYGYVTGVNGFSGGLWAIAERFETNAPAEVRKLKVKFHVGTISNPSDKIYIYILENNPLTGRPVDIEAKEVATVLVSDMNPTDYTEIILAKPVGVSGTFHVVFGSFLSSSMDVAIKSSPVHSIDKKMNTVSVKGMYFRNNAWAALSDAYGYDVSMNVVPEIIYAKLEIAEAQQKLSRKSKDTPEIIPVVSNIHWEATTEYAWIKINNGTGLQDGSFSVKCDDNPGTPRVGNVVLAGGGITYNIPVWQSGAGAQKLTATLLADEKSVQLNWDAPKPVYSSDIFDDFEGHPNFTINSPGSLGWRYYDVDGDPEAATIGTRYPNDLLPHAFITFDPYKTDPPQNDNLMQFFTPRAGSGTQYLLSLVSMPKMDDTGNDWIVSPALDFSGDFKFSFWANTLPAFDGYVRFRVMYSLRGHDKEDFNAYANGKTDDYYTDKANNLIILNRKEKQWTRYEFAIPKEARYVAIQVISAGGSFMLDDVFIGTGASPEKPTASGLQAAAQPRKPRPSVQTEVLVKLPTGAQEVSQPLKASSPLDNIGKMLYWHNWTPQGYIGLAEGGVIEAGCKWTASDLASYKSLRISAVDFIVGNAQRYVLKIYKSGQLAYSQQLANLIPGSANTILLDRPVIIEPDQDVIVSVEATLTPSQLAFGVDTGPAVDGKGNLATKDGGNTWGPLGGNYNMMLTLLTGSADNLYYIIYRDGQPAGKSQTPDYLDAEAVGMAADVCYSVRTMNDDGAETDPTNEACVFLRRMLHVKAKDITWRVGERTHAPLTLEYNGFLEGENESILERRPKAVSAANRNSAPGTYSITIEAGEDSRYVMVYENGILQITALGDEETPTAFMPGTGGENGVFLLGVPVQIYTRNGVLVKSSNNGWDGRNASGQMVSPGVYYYMATFGPADVRKGSIQVVIK